MAYLNESKFKPQSRSRTKESVLHQHRKSAIRPYVLPIHANCFGPDKRLHEVIGITSMLHLDCWHFCNVFNATLKLCAFRLNGFNVTLGIYWFYTSNLHISKANWRFVSTVLTLHLEFPGFVIVICTFQEQTVTLVIEKKLIYLIFLPAI